MNAPVWIVALVFGGIAASSRVVAAETIVIESHVGPRAKGTAEVLAPFYEELERREVLRSYPKVGQRFEARVTAPSQLEPGLGADFPDAVERAYRLWLAGNFQEALSTMQPLVEAAHRNPATIANNPKLGAAVFKGLVTLALCHHRLGNEAASKESMAELLRSFETEVGKAQYGAEAYEIFTRVRAELKASATGLVVVHATDEKAAIYINERFIELGDVSRTDLIPGRYRIFAQLGKKQGRLHSVEVKAGSKIQLEIDPDFESMFVTTPAWTGLSFLNRDDREKREGELAARFGEAIEVMGVIVVGLDVKNQRSIAYGALINSVTKKELRRASVVLDSLPPPERLRALARFLTGEQAADGIEVYEARPVLSIAGPATTAARRAPRSGWKWAASGGAIAGLGTGIGLLILDGNCTTSPPVGKCPDVYDLKVGGYMGIGAGVALGAVATWLWLRERSSGGLEEPQALFWFAPSHEGGVAGVTLPL
jgi:hypothetical protein